MISQARENARGAQETLSTQAWSQLNLLYLYLGSPRSRRRFQASPLSFYDRIKRECLLFAAIVDDTSPRTEPFHFLQLGRYLERVEMLSRILNARLQLLQAAGVHPAVGSNHSPVAVENTSRAMHWTSLLQICSANEAYLKLHQENIDPAQVIGFLILEADFPRALRFGVARCLESLRFIAGGGGGFSSESERQLGRLDSELRYMDINETLNRGLTPFLVSVQDICARVGQEIHQAYFLS
jgi:uncharacterized alpha-E superfamily protein